MRTLAACTFIAFAALLAGCGDAHDAAADEMIDVMKSMENVLAGVTDAASAEAAKGRLEALKEKMMDVMERAEKLEDPSEARQKELKERIEAAAEGLAKQAVRLAAVPEAAGILGEYLTMFSR